MSRPSRAKSQTSRPRISFEEFRLLIEEAIAENTQYYEEWQERNDLPAGGKFCDSMFHFVRRLRFDPRLAALNPATIADAVDRVLREIYGEDDDPWEVAFECSYSSPSYDAFVNLWAKVRQPIEYDQPLEEASRRDLEVEEILVAETDSPSPGRAAFRRFVSIAAHLQAILGDQDIALPVEALGGLLDVTPQRVGQMRENAVTQGILKKTRGHSHEAGLAARYRFARSDTWRVPRRPP